MSEETRQSWREEQARREIGRTEFAPGVAPFLAACFLAVLLGVPVVQHLLAVRERLGTGTAPSAACYAELAGAGPELARAWRQAPSLPARFLEANDVLLEHLHRFEHEVDEACFLTRLSRSPVQAWMCRLGVGNEKAFIGRDGRLFFEPGLTYLTAPGFLDRNRLRARLRGAAEWTRPPQPDPTLAILRMQLQLARRGIRLVVLPAPVKPSIHPEQMGARRARDAVPLQNASFAPFAEELRNPQAFLDGRLAAWERHGAGLPANAWRRHADELRDGRELLAAHPLLFFDPAPLLAQRKAERGTEQYLVTDTHWTPDALQAVARALAVRLRRELDLPPAEPNACRAESVQVTATGDIAAMLRLPDGQTLYPKQTVTIRQISRGRHLWRPDRDAPILLLGDSFANVYSLQAMGWGESAGLAEQLSYELGLPLDVMVRNDAGAHATRGMLARELQRGRDRLAGKRVVVYEFAARELAVGDWKMLDLALGEPRSSRFFVPEPGESVEVRGTVASVTAAPRPGSVPYRDHVVAVHLVDLESDDPDARDNEALVYVMSMKDNTWLPPARYRLGQEVRLRLRPWPDVEQRYGSLNRAEPMDEALMFEDPCWGVEVGSRAPGKE